MPDDEGKQFVESEEPDSMSDIGSTAPMDIWSNKPLSDNPSAIETVHYELDTYLSAGDMAPSAAERDALHRFLDRAYDAGYTMGGSKRRP